MSIIFIGQLPSTPLGSLWIGITEAGFAALSWDAGQDDFSARLARRFKLDIVPDPAKTASACSQVTAYLRGKRQAFDLPVDWSLLPPFQREVLQATCAIPYGETRTYGELAHELGRPHAARAVGRAEATNPLPLVIPCHRVIGADGKLHGYGGGQGLPTKEWLLRLEGAVLA
jgi:methylated-DNA-[protein]-cysteine S-methyltransferase